MFKFIPFGIIASIFQLVILREFSFSLAKNELAFITAAGFWIIFCALGSITETPKRIKGQPLFALSSLAFFSSITLIHTVKLFFGLKYYEPASLGLVLISSVALIGPLAFIIGNIFRFLVQDYLKSNPSGRNNYAKFFAYEAIGFFIGGLAFSLYLSKYTNPLIFSSLPVLLASAGKNNYKKITAMAIFILMAFFSFRGFNLILKNEFGRAKIIFNLGSRYGPVLSVDKSGVTVLYSEGSILVTSEDKASAEEFIHTSLSAINDVKNKAVLFIGAAFSQVAEEILKYEPASLDCLHINPVISMLAKDSLSEEISNKVSFIADDPRVYLKNTTKQYDAILMSMPAPLNLSLNRYFTEEFFALVSSRLKYKGIFSFSIPSKREILSPSFARFNSSIINAVDRIFKNRLLAPSDNMIIIVSNTTKVSGPDLIRNFSKINPKTKFFTNYHLQDLLNPLMQDYIQNNLDSKIKANTDFNPTGFLSYLILEQAKFYPGLKIDFLRMRRHILIILLFLASLIVTAAFLSKRSSCLLNAAAIGFTSIGLSSLIFVSFQIYCGGLFWKMGILIGLFMAGLSAGTLIMDSFKIENRKFLALIYAFWAIIILSLYLSLRYFVKLSYPDIVFYLYSLVCGMITGGSYPLLARDLKENKFQHGNITTAIYSADLTGAFLGTLLFGTLLIPFLGIPQNLAALIALNIIFALKNLLL